MTLMSPGSLPGTIPGGLAGGDPPRMRFRPWPRSLAGRTALTLLLALTVVQALGLMIHAFDRIGLQRLAEDRDIGVRIMSVYRSVVTMPADERSGFLREMNSSKNGF